MELLQNFNLLVVRDLDLWAVELLDDAADADGFAGIVARVDAVGPEIDYVLRIDAS
jgi:hypothetical protein